MIRVQLFHRERLLGDVTADGPECFLGKDQGSLIALRGWRIGKQQVQLSEREGGLFLKDGGGMATPRVNGNTVNEYGPLAGSDVIELLDYTIRAHLAPGGAQAAPELPEPALAMSAAPPASSSADTPAGPLETPQGIRLRGALHKKLIEAMDLRRVNVGRMQDDELRDTTRHIIEGLIETDPQFEEMRALKEAFCKVVLNEVVGLGPLEALLADDSITEIMVNKYNDVFVERDGRLTRSRVTFSNDEAVLKAIERIVSPLGRRIDESSPMVDARLKDGSRVNAIIAPLAIKGPSLTIRKFSKRKLTADDLIGFGALSAEMTAFLQMAVRLRANIIISGGTGSGKTTLLNVLSNYIPDDERIVTVEDAAELQLSQPNLVSLEAKPANIEGKGAVSIRDLVRNCLRMRPDRIVIGECRGGETLDMLQAMNTGHDGSLTTAHANSPRDCLSRLEVMTSMSGLDIPAQAIREQITSAIDLIVQQTRFSCGSRRVTHITEITGIENNVVSMQNIFTFKEDGFTPEGKVRGRFVASGTVPEFCQALIQRGIRVDVSIFSDAGRAPGYAAEPVKRAF